MRGVMILMVGGWLFGPSLLQDDGIKKEEGVEVRVMLANGDSITGKCPLESFQIRTRLDIFRIRLDRIYSVWFGNVAKEEPDRVESSDVTLKGFVEMEALELRTPYGKVKVPRKDLRRLLIVGPEGRSLRVRAWIDGRSRLSVKGNEVRWQHFEYDRPGTHAGANEPTRINGADWTPTWEGNQSKVQSFESFRLPDHRETIRLEILEARGAVRWIESEDGKGFSGMIEFDDNVHGGPAWYEVELRW